MHASPSLGPQSLCPSLELITVTNSLRICADICCACRHGTGLGSLYCLECGLQCILLKILLV